MCKEDTIIIIGSVLTFISFVAGNGVIWGADLGLQPLLLLSCILISGTLIIGVIMMIIGSIYRNDKINLKTCIIVIILSAITFINYIIYTIIFAILSKFVIFIICLIITNISCVFMIMIMLHIYKCSRSDNSVYEQI